MTDVDILDVWCNGVLDVDCIDGWLVEVEELECVEVALCGQKADAGRRCGSYGYTQCALCS